MSGTIKLHADASLIEVMRRFRQVGDAAKVTRAVHSAGIRGSDSHPAYWTVHYTGTAPSMIGLAAS